MLDAGRVIALRRSDEDRWLTESLCALTHQDLQSLLGDVSRRVEEYRLGGVAELWAVHCHLCFQNLLWHHFALIVGFLQTERLTDS